MNTKGSKRSMSLQLPSLITTAGGGSEAAFKHMSAPASARRRHSTFTNDSNTSRGTNADKEARKKDRLKGGKRGRDGTPDKSTTPSQEAQDENRPPSRHVIWDHEMDSLQITPDALEKLHAPEPPQEEKPEVTTKVFVRKMKPASELNKPKMKSVKVARPASPDAPLKPVDNSGYAGPRYDAAGRVLHYSILGKFDDFRREATKRGDLLDIPTPRISDAGVEGEEEELTLKYEKKKKKTTTTTKSGDDESNALRNWTLRMLERKRQQGYISKLLHKSPEDLAMNQAEGYRRTQEDRYLIDRTIPCVDYGKGYRVGSEFWKQQEQFGDELTGVHMTLTQTEKGYPPPVECVGIPNCARQEKGIEWEADYRTSSHHPWHHASYLHKRRQQLSPFIEELCPHRPDFSGLQVIGTNKPQYSQELAEDEESDEEQQNMEDQPDPDNEQDPFHEYPDTCPPPVFGPSMKFAGHQARWTGDSDSNLGQIAAEARVTFETNAGSRVTSYLEVVNDGTTAIFFDWKKLPKENPFDLVQPHVQRFYFNNSSGVILPGETLQMPFVFKAGGGGVFSEQWMFETRPRLCGGAALLLTLRGVSLEQDVFQQQREQLEQELEAKQAEQLVAQWLDDLVSGIRTPHRCPSPVDAYLTEEDIFLRFNPGLSYRHEVVSKLKDIHQQLIPEEDQDSSVWDLCILDLKDMIMELDEDDDRKETLLTQMSSLTSVLTFDPPRPSQDARHRMCHQLLCEAVDSMVTQSCSIRQTMGLTARDMTDLMEESDSKKGGRQSDKGKGSDAGGGKGDKKASYAAAAAAGGGKDSKAGKAGGKETPKQDSKSKAPTPTAGGKKAAPTPPTTGAGGVSDPPTSPPTSPQPSTLSQEQEEAMERKYRQKLYAQVYVLLGDKMQTMDELFHSSLATPH